MEKVEQRWGHNIRKKEIEVKIGKAKPLITEAGEIIRGDTDTADN